MESGRAPLPADQHGALAELQRLAHDKMKTLLRTRTLRGFPLNMPFTDVEEILTKVTVTCLSCLLSHRVGSITGHELLRHTP